MSATLKFRRGTVIPELLTSEFFWDENVNVLRIGVAESGSDYVTVAKIGESQAGSIILTGDVTADNGNFSGTVDITGDLIVGGSIILGDTPADPIEINGVLSGSLVPITGSTFNVGAPATRYSTLYVDSLDVSGGITATTVPWSGITSIPSGLVSGSSQIDHDTTTNFVANEHIDHTSVSISSGLGLSGGGTIDTTQTLTLDTGSQHFIDGVSSIAQPLPDGVVSGSSQLTSSYDTRYTLSGSVQPLPDGVVSGSDQLTSSLDDRYVLESESGSFLQNVVEDTSPQLGGDLQLNNNDIIGSGNIDITGYFSGSDVRLYNGLSADTWRILVENAESPSMLFYLYDSGSAGHGGVITTTYTLNGSGTPTLSTDIADKGWVDSITSSFEQVGSGILSSSWQDHETFSSSVDTRIDALEAGGLTEIVQDTTPQLGGNLDLNTNTISGSGNIDYLGSFTMSGSSDTFVFTDVITISGNANPNFSSVEVGNRLAVATPAFGGSRIGDAYLQTPSLDIGYNPAYTDSGAINFKSGSNQQTIAGMFTNTTGTVFTIKGFDDGIMVTDHTSITVTASVDDAESTIANTITLFDTGSENIFSYINDQGVQQYPNATTPVADTHFQILQNRSDGATPAPRKGFYMAFYSGSGDYDRIYSIAPNGDMEYENNFLITGSLTTLDNVSAGTTSTNQHNLVGKLIVSSSTTPALAVSGAIEATGEITAYAASDERLKLNMTPIENPIRKVLEIGGYEYDWDETKQRDKKGHDVGVSAQEVQKVLPEVVTERDNGYLAVRYEKMVPLLIEAIKEQQKEIEELKRRLDEK